MLAQGDPVTSPAPEGSPTPGAQPDPETVPSPAPETEPGQETLPAETPPEPPDPSEGGEGAGTGEPETVLPESDNAELTQALAGLSPTERQKALELVKALPPGEIPRIAKLVSKVHTAEQTIEAQAKRIEELETKGETPPTATGASPLPTNVAKLKSLAEVNSRLDVVEGNANALQDFLDANPGDKNTVYDLTSGEAVQAEPDGKRFATRQQIVDQKAALRAEAKALPKRAQEITRQAQFNQAKTEARAKIVADFPYLSDPENPDTKAAQQLLKSDPVLNSYAHGDYLALALARGHRELQAEAAARKGNGHGKINGNGNGNGNGKTPFGTPATGASQLRGKVPLGKPHAPAGVAPPRAADGANVKTALEAHGKNGSRSSLAEVISAAGL